MEQSRPKRILFLCTDNYYRSRFAEVLFNSLAEKHGLPWKTGSRGLALERGIYNVGPMAVEAIDSLMQLGVCIGPSPSGDGRWPLIDPNSLRELELTG